MKKYYISLSNKISLLLFFTLIFIKHSAFSQCTNPNPTGSFSQEFCKSENSKVSNLDASGGREIVWFDTLFDGNKYSNTDLLFDGTIYYTDIIDGGNCSPNRLEVTIAIYGDTPTNVDMFVGKCNQTTIVSQEVYVLTKNTI
jgi:hypothetical protein